jgi:uncharacterized cupredoxin-like copper-binding protein
MRYRNILLAVVVALAAGAVASCGGDDDGNGDGTTTAADTGTLGGASAVTIKMGEFYFNPKDVTAAAGTVEISAPNEGQTEHEMVLFRSDADPASLPVSGNEVDEQAFEAQGAENLGEIEEVGPGQTKSGSFKLTTGKYVMICNLPGHYAQGMYGSVTVK